MQKEYLIKKWLDNELTVAEESTFKNLEEYKFLTALTKDLKEAKLQFNYNEELAFSKLKDKIAIKKGKKTKIVSLKFITRIASIFILGLSILFYFTNKKTITTQIGETKVYILPDSSRVTVDALSNIKLKRFNWDRNIALNGEAYFEVKKGKKFIVNTKQGSIRVLGTKFNIIERKDYFEIICYEGSVLVTANNKEKILKPGESYLVIEKKIIETKKLQKNISNWINNKSFFRKTPIKYVLKEFERHYNIKIIANFNTNELFTGSFIHDNKKLALKTITLPLNLNISSTKKSITLSKND
jgi:transmembrane sensor|tara:strand:- start:2799 stop:3695 length:897 start_codon:yes stop_codon:yes gene_type:complete